MARTLYLGTICAQRATANGGQQAEYNGVLGGAGTREEIVGVFYSMAEARWPREDGWYNHAVKEVEVELDTVVTMALGVSPARGKELAAALALGASPAPRPEAT